MEVGARSRCLAPGRSLGEHREGQSVLTQYEGFPSDWSATDSLTVKDGAFSDHQRRNAETMTNGTEPINPGTIAVVKARPPERGT